MAGSKNNFESMAGIFVVGAVIIIAFMYLQPTMFKKDEGFKGTLSAASNYTADPGQHAVAGEIRETEVRANPDVVGHTASGPADFGNAEAPAGCYPREQLNPSELLPKDANSVWAEQNPMGNGSLKGKNFLSAGALIGVNTVGQSLRNANYQLRSEPPNPQVAVSVFLNSTIEPDVNRRNLEIA